MVNKKWRRRDVILLLERLGLYTSSGLTIDKVLLIIGQGLSKKYRLSIDKVRSSVVSGSSISKSLETHIGLSKTISSLIGHGESSGGLVRALVMAQRLLEKEDELLKKCMSALAYPIVIGIFASLLTIGLVRGVMPQIIPMLKSLHVQLPLLTRMVMSVSENLISYGLYVLCGAVFVVILSGILYRKMKPFQTVCQYTLIHIPIVGRLVYLYSLSIFLQSSGSLVESGLQIEQAYSNTVHTITLIPLSRLLQAEIPNIRKGIPLGKLLTNRSKLIPPHVPSLALAGQASGTLGSSMIRAASIIDRDMEHSLKRLTSLIEPVMMAGMGCVVGGIALSIMMPIYDISRALQH